MSDAREPGPTPTAAADAAFDATADAPAAATTGMGVSSERVGPSGPGQVARTGLRDTSRLEPGTDQTSGAGTGAAEARPEQSSGGVEVNPDPIALTKAGYPQQHPRSKERPFYRRGS